MTFKKSIKKGMGQHTVVRSFSNSLPGHASIAKITHPKAVGVFPRERLFRLLDESRESPVIWVSAPAGSGKTTLVASYLAQRKLESIWYCVDEGDWDVATFFYYMGLAVRKVAPRSQKTLPMLTKEYLLGIPTFTLRYFEELYSRLKPPFAIVLDNYQHLQASVQTNEVVVRGLDIVPDGINIILISREEPPPQYARLRGNGKLSFLGKDKIFFTIEESGSLLRLKGFQDLTDSMLHEFYERTRGWAAGLVLIMERAKRKGLDGWLLSSAAPWEIFDYFAVEIFEKADAETQAFLLRTAFLPTMTISAAERLTGIVRSGEILFHLHGDQFFTEKNTETDPGFRYHPLFREFLLARARDSFPHDEIAMIQCDAAHLLIEAGQMEDAANLLIDAGDWDGFVPFLLDYAPVLMAQGRMKTLGEWLAAIPADLVENSPWLLYWLGHCAFVVTPAEGRAYLEEAFQLFIDRNDDTGALLTWAGIADTFIYDFDYFKPLDRWIDWLDERIERDQSFPTPAIESAVASSMVGVLVWRRPDHAAMQQWIERALSSSQESQDGAIRLLALRRALLYYTLVGDQGGSLTVLEEIGRIVESHSAPPSGLIAAKMIKARYYAVLGDDADRAIQMAEEGFSLAERSGIHIVDSFLALMGAYAAINKGDDGEVVKYAAKFAATLRPGRRYAVFYHHILSMRFLFIGKYAAAQAHAKKMQALSEESGHAYPEIWARTLLSQVAYEMGDIVWAENELDACEKFYLQVDSHYFVFSTCLLRAYYFFGQGKENLGLEALAKALELGRRNGYTYSTMLFRPQVWSLLCAKALGGGIEIEYTRQLILKRKLAPPVPAAAYENWPWPVKVYALGRFELFLNGKPLEFRGKAPRRIISFLRALLACGAKGTSEEKLVDILWPESDGDTAHYSFSANLHRLRQLMGNEKALHLRDGHLRLDPGICWVDAHAFEELLARAEEVAPLEGERLTEKALMLYGGQFLEESNEPWTISYREQLRNKFLRAMWRRGEQLEGIGHIDLAIELYRKGLEVDPLGEELYCRLMKCHHVAEQRGDAIAAYEKCKKILRSVLGIEPSPETEALYRAIKE